MKRDDDEEVEEEKPVKVKNFSQELEGQRQLQKKIDLAFRKASQNSYKKYEKELKEKNTYFSKNKLPDENQKDLTMQETKMKNKFKSTLEYTEKEKDAETYYCQKCPSGKNHCPHKIKKEQVKDKYPYPIVSSSAYGWLPPIDNMVADHNLNSVTRTFFDHSHL
jgi:hypothetical protein